ncbi:hypothetical protein MACJ_000455 [Theileria orientalis]|uniref:Uncharacterized protein n=1 Tax=Theileria orientalis TaxID=68886 RepID=A0A976M6C8_THEOR|nr:hypothetical protein MACJ_000455 [Theileria orientalis]
MYKIFFVTKLTGLLILGELLGLIFISVGIVTAKAADDGINETHSASGGSKEHVYTLCGPWSDWTQCNHLNKQHRSRACTHRRGAVPDYSGKKGDLTPEERDSFDKYFKMLNNGQSGDFVQMPEIQTRACTSDHLDLDEGIYHSAPRADVGHIKEEIGVDIDPSRGRRRTRSESDHSHPASRDHSTDSRSSSADSRSPSSQAVRGVGNRPHRTGFKARREARERRKAERQDREKQRKIREDARKDRLRSGIYTKYPLTKVRDTKEMQDDAEQRRLDELEARSDEEEREHDFNERKKRKNKSATETATTPASATGGDNLPPIPDTSRGANPLGRTPITDVSETGSEPPKAPLYENCASWGDWTPCNHINKQHRFRRCTYKRGNVPDYSARLGDLTEDEKIKYEVVNQLVSQYDDAEHVNKNDIETRRCANKAPTQQTPVVEQPSAPNASTVVQPESTKREVAETVIKPSVAQPVTARPPVNLPVVVGETKKVDHSATKEVGSQIPRKQLEGYPTVINGSITPVVRMKKQSRGHDLPPEVPMLSKESYNKLMKKFSPNLFRPLAVNANKSKIPIKKATSDLEGDEENPEDKSTDEANESSPLVPVSSEKTSLKAQMPREEPGKPSTEASKGPTKKAEQKTEPVKEPTKKAEQKTEPVKEPTKKIEQKTQPVMQPKKPVVDSKAQDKSKHEPAKPKANTQAAAKPPISGANKATTSQTKPLTTATSQAKPLTTATSPQKKPLVSAASKPKAPVKSSPATKPKPSYKPRPRSPAPKPKPSYKPRPRSPAPKPKPSYKPKPKPSTPKPAAIKVGLAQPPKDVVTKTADSSGTSATTNLDQSNTVNPDTSSASSASGGDLPPIVPDVPAESVPKRHGGDLPLIMPDITEKRRENNHGGDLPPIVPDVPAESVPKRHGGDLPLIMPEAEPGTPELPSEEVAVPTKPELPSEEVAIPTKPETESEKRETNMVPEPVEVTPESTENNKQDNHVPLKPEPERITVKTDESSDDEDDSKPGLPTESATPQNDPQSTTITDPGEKGPSETVDEDTRKPEEVEPEKSEEVEPEKSEEVEPEKSEGEEPVKPNADEHAKSPEVEPEKPEEEEPVKPNVDEHAKSPEVEPEKPEEEEPVKPNADEVEEEAKKNHLREDDEDDYQSPRIRIPTSDDHKTDTTGQGDDSQTKPELPKAEEQPTTTDPKVDDIIDDFDGLNPTAPTEKLDAEVEEDESEDSPRVLPAEEIKKDEIKKNLTGNGENGHEEPEPSTEEEEPEEESPNYNQTGDKTHKEEEKPKFGKGVTIAAGVFGALLFLAAGGAGYHYTRKNKKRTLEPTDVEVVGFQETDELQPEETETAVYITEEVWDS